MKKIVGVLFVFLFFVSSVYAVCSEDQTIVRLYRENNSHVSIYDDANYLFQICYGDLFGYNYTGSNPHDCTVANTNAVFWVNSSRNSHISAESSEEYSTPICYGNLDCSFKPSCDPNNEVLLLKTYDVENSHVSLSQPEYTQSVCCKNSVSLRNSFWSDLNGQEITTATLGDTVLMVAKGFEFEGKNLSYTLISSTGSPIGSALTKTWNWLTFRGWQETENWVQTSTNEWTIDKVGSFRFRVNIGGTNFTSLSFTELDVKSEGAGINEKPFVNITSNRTLKVLIGTNVSFNATVYDSEDFLTAIWDYSDGKIDVLEHYSLATASKTYLEATHSFSSPGHYVVRLTASEEQPQRAQSNYDSVEVFVYAEGANVMPIVSSPIDKKYDYVDKIRFIASESYVANCSNSSFRTVYNFTINGTSLNCVYIHAPNQPTIGEGYSLDLVWFLDGVVIEQGNWESLALNPAATGTIQNFLRYFPESERHTAQLNLRYTSN